MEERFAIEITMMRVFTQRLPRVQAWVGEGLYSDGAEFTVTVQSYGEAALTMVRTLPASDDRLDSSERPRWRNLRAMTASADV
jgi:hypothetical protein